MTRFTFLLIFMALFSYLMQAQSDEKKTANIIDLETQQKIIVDGNLEIGTKMPLEWAANSSVACFPATRFNEYTGNHVLYRVEMPAYSKIEITVSPKSKKKRINLYALRLGAGSSDAPPEIFSAVSCEASYPKWAGTPNYRKPSKPKSVDYISIRNPYSILIGVAGAAGLSEGDYELKVKISKR